MEQNLEKNELTFEEKFILAYKLVKANDELNSFIAGYGGIDTFAESWANIPEPRAEYDRLQDAANAARAEFDENIHDKDEFVLKLKEAGRDRIADRISEMLAVSLKDKLLSIFKRGKK